MEAVHTSVCTLAARKFSLQIFECRYIACIVMNNYVILYLFQVISWSKVRIFIYFVEKWHLFTFFNGTALYLRPSSDSICACHRILFVLV